MMDNKLSELSKPVNIFIDGKPLYSQEYVSALKHDSAVNWEAAASLNVENQELKKRITELEARLATPVRLPDIEFVKISGIDFPVMRADIVKKEVRRAGFKVEGDE